MAVALNAVLLLAVPCAAHAGDIRFAVAQDYPASTVTYLGTASPGAVTHLYRDGHADRNADMVIGNTAGGPVVLYGLGGGRFSTERTIVDNADTDASAVQVADLNGDGISDIVSGGYTTERITVMLGRPDGSFRVSGQYQLQGVWPSQIQIADLDRDGHLDLAVAAYYGGTITILLGAGDGTFHEAPAVPATHVALALLVADLNGDRVPDLAVTETSPTAGTPGDSSQNLLHGSVELLLGNGDGTFRPSASYAVGALSELIRLGDIDEDGKADLIVLNSLITNEASILYGLGEGRFAPAQRLRIGGPSSVNVLDVRGGDGSEGLQLVDLDGDGHLDLAVTQMISSRLVIFAGDGRGHFAPDGSYDTAGFPEDLMAGDLDGDGCPDLAVPGNEPPIGPADVGIGRVSVFLNLSAGCGTAPARSACPAATRGAPVAHAKLSGPWLTFRARRDGTVRITWRFPGHRRAPRLSKHLTGCRKYRLRAPAGARGAEVRDGSRVVHVRRRSRLTT
jgi:hypothetical protein